MTEGPSNRSLKPGGGSIIKCSSVLFSYILLFGVIFCIFLFQSNITIHI